MNDAIREIAHTHDHLTKLVRSVGELIRDGVGNGGRLSPAQREEALASIEILEEELLHHFADEEEGLFPFVRQSVPHRASIVDRLEAMHDSVCGTIVRLAHLAQREGAELLSLYNRFETGYADHAREETALFEQLTGELAHEQRFGARSNSRSDLPAVTAEDPGLDRFEHGATSRIR